MTIKQSREAGLLFKFWLKPHGFLRDYLFHLQQKKKAILKTKFLVIFYIRFQFLCVKYHNRLSSI